MSGPTSQLKGLAPQKGAAGTCLCFADECQGLSTLSYVRASRCLSGRERDSALQEFVPGLLRLRGHGAMPYLFS
jgi:hypothetical protein